jgi:hypothetical protein
MSDSADFTDLWQWLDIPDILGDLIYICKFAIYSIDSITFATIFMEEVFP